MAEGLGKGLLEIAMALLGIALVALIIGKADKTSRVVTDTAGAFNNLLRTVTLQNGMGMM